MKRSEMVEKLANKLTFTDTPYDIAESLLEFIEEAGMVPPAIGIGEEDKWGYLIYENKWEDENSED